MWPKDEPLGRKLLLTTLNLIHIAIIVFVSVGWLLIPPGCKGWQMIYIGVLTSLIVLYCIFNRCILTVVKERLYTRTIKTNHEIDLIPLSKKGMYIGWLLLLAIGFFNYMYPHYSAFCMISRYFTCPGYC